MKRFFKFFGTYMRAAPKVLIFELIFKLMLTALGAPLLSFLLKTAMKYSGVSYISGSSLKKFLLSPVTAAILILMLFTVAFFSIIELSALIGGFACIREHRKITITGMIKCGLMSFCKAFRGMGILSFIGFMLIIPLAQFTLSSGTFTAPVISLLQSLSVTAPKPLFAAGFILLETAIACLLAGRCYTLHFLVLTDYKFSDCTKKSRNCLKGKRLRTALTLVIWSLIMLAIAALVAFMISFLIIFGIKGFSRPEAALTSSLKVLSYVWEVFFAISSVISAPFIIGCLTEKFFEDTKNEERIVLPETDKKEFPKTVKFGLFAAAAAVGIFLNFSYIQAIYKGNVNFNVGIFDTTQVTAHRGFSYKAPENTLYAFEAAIEAGADYIELDVQQTADGQVVVFHDEKLNRTTDGSGPLSDYSYDELLKLSSGSWFKKGGEDFSDAKIMLLSDVLELAKNSGCLLNIEIKKSGNTADTALKTAEMLMEYGMEDSCYVTSFDYTALKTVKKINSQIKTAIIANIASPTFYSQLKYIDALSLNYLFVTQAVISNAHKSGKRVFVWTVNSRSEMERMVSIGADNIITDRPDVALEAVYSYGKGDFIISILKQIFGT